MHSQTLHGLAPKTAAIIKYAIKKSFLLGV